MAVFALVFHITISTLEPFELGLATSRLWPRHHQTLSLLVPLGWIVPCVIVVEYVLMSAVDTIGKPEHMQEDSQVNHFYHP